MSDIIQQYITQIILSVFLALAAFLGAQAKALYKKYITTEIKQNVVRTAVRFVEQVYLDLHGPEKLARAMARASEILETEYGITISETELISMIEAAVNEFNNAFQKTAGQGNHLPGSPTAKPAAEDPDPAPVPTAEEIIADLKDVE